MYKYLNVPFLELKVCPCSATNSYCCKPWRADTPPCIQKCALAQVVTLADQLAAAREELAKERGEVDDFLAAQDYRKYCAWVEDAQADVVSGRGERPGSLPM